MSLKKNIQNYSLTNSVQTTFFWKEGQNKNLRDLQKNYDMNDSHYIIFDDVDLREE